MSVVQLLARRLPSRVADVVELLRALEEALPPGDGVAPFLRLYRAVTEAVEREVVPGGDYADPRFVRWLDVVFARGFFRAFREAEECPRAWAPLFEARTKPGIAPLQFALAGMNAHVNRDLPFALVETWDVLGLEPKRGSPQQRDFVRLNTLLEETEEQVKAELVSGPLGHLERSLGDLDDAVAIWKLSKARDAAWVNGETLWELRSAPKLRAEYARTLDGLVGFAGRGLLRPLGS